MSTPSAAQVFGTVVIGGGTGFVGQAIREALELIGVRVIIVSRMPGTVDTITWEQLAEEGLPATTGAVINVSGENVFNPRKMWTPGFQQDIISSRVSTTNRLAHAIQKMKNPPKAFVTVSGVGYYKSSLIEEYTEYSNGGDFDFFSNLCRDWESASALPPHLNVRNVIIRSGLILGKNGGMISRMYIPFFLGIGGPIGDGKQYMPWIQIEDIVRLFLFSIENDEVSGVLNGVAPHIITNYEFTKVLGRTMWRPTVLPIPAFVLKYAFGPERAKMMLEGQKVIPKRTLELGFNYKYPDIKSACIASLQ